MPIKTLGSLGKIRVGRVTGNTHIFFFGLTMWSESTISLLAGPIQSLATRMNLDPNEIQANEIFITVVGSGQ